MTDQELMEKIRISAEQIEVPEELSPDSMKEKLLAAHVQREGKWYEKISKSAGVRVAAAFLVCGVGIFAVYGSLTGNRTEGGADSGCAGASDQAAFLMSEEREAEDTIANEETDNKEVAVVEPKHNAGDMYVVAGSYEKVYDVIENAIRFEQNRYMTDGAVTENAVSSADDVGAGGTVDTIMKEPAASADLGAEKKFSETNKQMSGVDESDIIKTDGSYIYVVSDDRVSIIGTHTKTMKKAGEITIPMSSAADQIREMYVNGDILSLIVQKEEVCLEEQTKWIEPDDVVTENGNGLLPIDGDDTYYMDSKAVTELQTYDISDRTKPVLKGTVTQDGYYETSRKIGDIIYLFTNRTMIRPQMTRGDVSDVKEAGRWIPLINGEAISADCIFLPQEGSQGLVISSLNVKHPDKIVDHALIVNNDVEIYVSTESLYLYNQHYSSDGMTTQIAKFTLKEGIIDAAGAATAPGQIYDTFAINEHQGKLRVLTTDWSSSVVENNLYLFDKDLNLTGKLTGIAAGEEIYAARYIGNMAYFITYRNTDPLFAVDLTDDTDPKILSELKITGFSEYLHFWGEDKLVGIGYETDPDDGRREGIKLVMFDISNPADLSVAGTCVIRNIDYTPALYDYKCVLADKEENLIGFASESYGRQNSRSYLLFKWEDGNFKNLMTENIGDEEEINQYRGIYIGEVFYIVGADGITSYDRENDYRMIQELEL